MSQSTTRILLLLLLLANIGFFAYHRLLSGTDEAAAQIAALQISPEKIVPVAVEAVSSVAPAPVSATAPANAPAVLAVPSPLPAPASCAEWGLFAGSDVARAEAALAALGLPAGATQRRITEVDGYWVHMPPQKTKGEVDRKVGELKALGVTEFFVVTDAGPWRNAVSLGLFKNEDAAKAELDRLRALGVRSAMVTRRERFLKQVAFVLSDPATATLARLTELQKDFPAAEIKTGSCPASTPAKS
ncbi:MAG: SPOR domain-containing protein [Burkholderiales bacterium]|nr:SPOR domain-containing protein [Burkholderiales bacterium]